MTDTPEAKPVPPTLDFCACGHPAAAHKSSNVPERVTWCEPEGQPAKDCTNCGPVPPTPPCGDRRCDPGVLCAWCGKPYGLDHMEGDHHFEMIAEAGTRPIMLSNVERERAQATYRRAHESRTP